MQTQQTQSTLTFGKRSALSIFLSSVISAGIAFSAQAASFTVNVTGSGCASGAQVVAIVQSAKGPDGTKSAVAVATSTGAATFNNLNTTDAYQFMAVNAGCSPSMRDQAQDPTNFSAPITDGGNKTIALTSGASDATFIMPVKLPAAGTFPKLVMGNCSIGSNNVQAAYAIASLSVSTGSITFFNLRPAAGNTYQCGVYDPADNKGGGAPIGSALTAGQVFTLPGTVDLTQTFSPPPSTENEASRAGTQSGSANLTVFVSSADGTTAIAGAQLRLKNSQTGSPIQFNMSDPNGVGNFYNLQNGPTFYFMDVIAPGWKGQMNLQFSTTSWSVTMSSQVQLSPLTNGGTLSGVVKMNGANLPNVWVNCNPDYRNYPGSDAFGGNQSNPGAGFSGTNTGNGTFSFPNLVPGNYECLVNSPFANGGTRINDGVDNLRMTADDLRLTISTAGVFQVWNTSGSLVSSATPVNVNIAVSTANVTGTISGTLAFPDNAVLTSSPIVIMAWEQSVANSTTSPRGGIAIVNGSGATQTYTMAVPTGGKYFLQVKGINYGAVNVTGDRYADLTTATSATGMDFTLAKAGSVQVTILGPDGLRWLPALNPPPGAPPTWWQTSRCGGWINANGQSVRSWNSTDVDGTGIVNIPGLPAGTYRIQFNGQGAGCTVTDALLENVVVGLGKVTNVTMDLKTGVAIDVQTGALPSSVVLPPQVWKTGGIITAQAVALQRGAPLALEQLRAMGENTDPSLAANLIYASFSNQQNQTKTGFIPQQGGGNQTAPKVVPGNLTFYLFATRHPDWESTSGTVGFDYRTLLGKVNVTVDAAHQTALSTVFGSSVVAVSIPSPTAGNATVTGAVKGTHIFTKDDFLAAGGDSTKTFKYIPICAVYDSNGALLAFADAIPPALTLAQRQTIDAAQQANDSNAFLTAINKVQFGYGISLLPAGIYSLACTTPNYPPVTKSITLTAGQTTIMDIDFDGVDAGGTLSGTVSDAAGTPLVGATVKIRTKTFNKSQTTDSSGAYAFANLADGIYRMEATNPGYASATEKVIVTNGVPVTATFALTAAAGSITGTVYASVFPNKVFAAGAKVYAYDDTINGARLSPDAPHWITQTDSNGIYTLPNPKAGDVIKVFATTEGKYPNGVQATATAGTVSAPDIILTAVPPTPSLQFHQKSATTMDLLLVSPKLLAINPTMKCSAGATYADATATDYSAFVLAEPGNRYEAIGITPPAAASICRVITDDGIKQQTIDTAVNLSTVKDQSNNTIREEAFGGSAEGDGDGRGACIDFPMGSIVTSSGTVPTVQLVRNVTPPSGVTSQTVFSDSFQLNTDANLQLANGKDLDITLPLNKDKIPNFHSMRLAQIVNGVAKPVNSSGFCDPLTGRCTFSIKSLTNAATSIRYASGSPGLRGLAPFVGGRYAYDQGNAAASGGSFALIGDLAAPLASTTSVPTSFSAYNFPNPFDMSNKSLLTAGNVAVPSSDGGAIATAIHYDLPAVNAGHVIIRIFSVAGELVRVLDQGVLAGGVTYYATWDGKNANGAHVASGVYFAVFDVPGLTPKEHVVKMAVLK